MNVSGGVDRRRFARQSVRSLAYVELGQDNGGIVLNVSEGGLAVAAATPMVGAAIARVRFRLPGSAVWIETEARIAWMTETRKEAGILFVDLPEFDRVRIREWVAVPESPAAAAAPGSSIRAPGAGHVPAHGPQLVPAPKPSPGKPAAPVAAPPAAASPLERLDSELLAPLPLDDLAEVAVDSFSTPLAGEESQPGMPLEPAEAAWKIKDEHWLRPQSRPSRVGLVAVLVALIATGSFAVGMMSGRHSWGDLLARLRRSAVPGQGTESVSVANTGAEQPLAPPAAQQQQPPPAEASEPPSAPAGAEPPPNSAEAPAPEILPGSAIPRGASPPDLQQQPQAAAGSSGAPSGATGASNRAEPPSAANPLPPAPAPRAAAAPPIAVAVAPPAGSATVPPAAQPPAQAKSQPAAPAPGAGAPSAGAPSAGAPSASAPAPAAPIPAMPATPAPAAKLTGSVEVLADPYPSIRVPASERPSRVGTTLQLGQLATRVDPVYPPQAIREAVQGIVQLHILIATDGTIMDMQVVRGPQLLIPAVRDAVGQWRYQPTYLGKDAVETEADVTVTFRLVPASP